MTDETPNQAAPEPPPRRLTRSSTDKLVGGVAGGIGRHLGVDPLAIRITFVILTFAGGLGVLAYLACLVFVPTDDPDAPPPQWGLARTLGAGLLAVAALALLSPDWLWGGELFVLLLAGGVAYLLIRVVRDDGTSHFGRLAARTALGVVLVALSIGGFVAAAAGSALGGGIAVAGLIVACGIGLVGGAFRGGARWLIFPALLLALPLGAVAASDLDARGSWGERTFRPVDGDDLARGYTMGVGEMTVDLRAVDVPPGRTDLELDLGFGEIRVVVPDDLCVTTHADVGIGTVNTGDGSQDGVDLHVDDDRDAAAGVRRVHLDVDIDIGELRVGYPVFDFGPDDRFNELELDGGMNPAACAGTA